MKIILSNLKKPFAPFKMSNAQQIQNTQMSNSNDSSNSSSPSPRSHNGRLRAKQVVEYTRQNHPNKQAPLAEFWDNSISWGKANNTGTIITKTSIHVLDDGNFISPEVFKKMWTETLIGTETRYDSNDELLGRYNVGATDSVIILGKKGTFYSNFNGSVFKTEFDVSQFE